ncbi:MAG: glutathione binding-like protein, partial [Pseudomonadota bacterium]
SGRRAPDAGQLPGRDGPAYPPVRQPEKRPEAVIPFLQGRLKAAYTVLNDHLEGRNWVAGEAVTIADLSCCGYLYYPEPYGFDRKDWPNIDRWLDRISALPGWKHPYDLLTRAFPAA